MELKREDRSCEDSLRAVIRQILRDDPQDPLFQLYEYFLEPEWKRDSPKSRRKLEAIRKEATRRQDEATVRRAGQILKDLDAPPIPPVPMPIEPDDAADDGDPFADDLPPPNLRPEQAAKIAEMIGMLRQLPEAELRRLRKARPKDIPEFVLDMLIEAAKSGMPLPPVPRPPPSPAQPKTVAPPPVPPPPVPPPPASPAPVNDPRQLDLF
jgi:hypothetical protein